MLLVSLQLFGVFQFMSTSHAEGDILTCTMSFHNEGVICPFKWIDSAWQWFADLAVVPFALFTYLILLVILARFSMQPTFRFRIPWKRSMLPRIALQYVHRMHIVPSRPLHDAFSSGIIHPKVYCLYR